MALISHLLKCAWC